MNFIELPVRGGSKVLVNMDFVSSIQASPSDPNASVLLLTSSSQPIVVTVSYDKLNKRITRTHTRKNPKGNNNNA